jgi:hypothetical protein
VVHEYRAGGRLPARRLRTIYVCYAVLSAGIAALLLRGAVPGRSLTPVSILTANGDNYRTNANLHETQLTPENVGPASFGKLGSFSTDGQVYAQPLYVSNLIFPGGTRHNVLFIATMHNSVYAYDADALSDSGLLWSVNLGPSFPSSLWKATYFDISPEAGILGTGTIDLAAGVLYVVAETLQNGIAVFDLHALDLVTGAERMNGPVAIQAGVSGSGSGSRGGQVLFDPVQHLQRPGLLLANNAVYVGFGSHMDQIPWHGWVMSYAASDLTVQRGLFMATPSGNGGAIWQSGRGMAADNMGNVYAMAGNGEYDGVVNFGESFLKLSGAAAKLADWFTPSNWPMLDSIDADLSTGPAVIPGTHTIVGGDKSGQLYLVNGDSMGKLGSGASREATIFTGAASGGMFNFALWAQPATAYIYVQGEQDVVKSYRITSGAFDKTPVSHSVTTVSVPRVGMTISANGARNGILWETTGDFGSTSVPGTLQALDAANLAHELWNSGMNPSRDALGGFVRFSNPTVVRGRVYVGTASGSVVIYGLICSAGNVAASAAPCITSQI